MKLNSNSQAIDYLIIIISDESFPGKGKKEAEKVNACTKKYDFKMYEDFEFNPIINIVQGVIKAQGLDMLPKTFLVDLKGKDYDQILYRNFNRNFQEIDFTDEKLLQEYDSEYCD